MTATYTPSPHPYAVPPTWSEWTDPLGQIYQAGDHVAIAIISGRSPQLVIGEVIQINRVDSKGMEIYKSFSDRVQQPDGSWKYEPRKVPHCTVKVQPLKDTRGFYRSGNAPWNSVKTPPRAVTYRLIENIIKVQLQP